MITVAGYCGARLVVSGLWGVPTHRLVDFSHLLMGWAMAGMYIPVLMSPVPPQAWQLIFVVLTVIFFIAVIRARQRGKRSEESAHRNHGITAFAMVFMLVEMPSGHSGGAMNHMSLHPMSHHVVATTEALPAGQATSQLEWVTSAIAIVLGTYLLLRGWSSAVEGIASFRRSAAVGPGRNGPASFPAIFMARGWLLCSETAMAVPMALMTFALV
jgi:hypothetical protein